MVWPRERERETDEIGEEKQIGKRQTDKERWWALPIAFVQFVQKFGQLKGKEKVEICGIIE